eukprot:6204777-Pleurochrysis_carterae.AAC.3
MRRGHAINGAADAAAHRVAIDEIAIDSTHRTHCRGHRNALRNAKTSGLTSSTAVPILATRRKSACP